MFLGFLGKIKRVLIIYDLNSFSMSWRIASFRFLSLFSCQ
ncbi:hypothetical protein M2E15_6192 [Bacillus mycoides]|nr:hypothetical protein M2E15_6192 [Bacillus mycoides]